jgi:hypothetical protein
VSEKPYTLAALCARELPVEQIEQGAAWTPAGVQLGWGNWCGCPKAAESKEKQNATEKCISLNKEFDFLCATKVKLLRQITEN